MDKPNAAKPRVMIESPYAGDIACNIAYAQMAVQHSLSLGEAPFAMHLLYPQVLRDEVPEERELGISCGLAWLAKADLVAFYIDLGTSAGMIEAHSFCRHHSIPMTFRSINPQGASRP